MINIFLLLFHRWFDKSSGATVVQKAANAMASIRQFYAFVINGVSILWACWGNTGSIFKHIIFAQVRKKEKTQVKETYEIFSYIQWVTTLLDRSCIYMNISYISICKLNKSTDNLLCTIFQYSVACKIHLFKVFFKI